MNRVAKFGGVTFIGAASTLLLCAALFVGGCGGGEGDDGNHGDGGSGKSSHCKSEIPAGQGASQPCCPEWGADACGALLFCDAFDGRVQPTCYPERSRSDQTGCHADNQCISGSCNTDVSLCRSMPLTSCRSDIGCSDNTQGHAYVCDATNNNTCQPVGRNGLCATNDDCDSRSYCFDNICQFGNPGNPCHVGTECWTGICVQKICRYGNSGDPCGSDADCDSHNSCVNGVCSK